VANFSYHRGYITAVEWCPYESSMLASAGADHQVRLLEEEATLMWGGRGHGVEEAREYFLKSLAHLYL
jgi:hypothetical protein